MVGTEDIVVFPSLISHKLYLKSKRQILKNQQKVGKDIDICNLTTTKILPEHFHGHRQLLNIAKCHRIAIFGIILNSRHQG